MDTTTTSSTATHGIWLILAAAVLWGTTGTSQALAPVGSTPAAIGALRLAAGGATLLLITTLRKGQAGTAGWPLLPTLCGAIFMASYQLCFFAAVARTGVAAGTMVAIGSSPVIAGILAIAVTKEFPGVRWTVSTLLAVCGCCLLTAGSGGLQANLSGILLAVCAGASYALYTLAIKSLLPGRSPDRVMAVLFCLGALLLSPLLLGAELGWLLQPRGMLVFAHLGVVATALSYALFTRGLSSIPVATAVTLSLAEPLTAATLGVLVLEERVTLQGGVGMALLFTGLALLAMKKK